MFGEPARQPPEIEERIKREKRNQLFSKVAYDPKVGLVLQEHGMMPDDVRNIFFGLVICCGEHFARRVVQSSGLLSEYLQIKADGVPDNEIWPRMLEFLHRQRVKAVRHP